MAQEKFRRSLILAAFAALSIMSAPAAAQVSSGKATTAAPTYGNNTVQPLSLDGNGNLRVVTSGGGGGTSDVNIDEVGGTPVSNTTPGVLDINCLTGCSGGGSGGAVDVTDIGGVPVVSTTPGTFDVTCIAGCSAPIGTSDVNLVEIGGNALTTTLPISGTVTATGTVAATQSGTWDIGTVTAVTAITNALPAGTNNIGDVDVLSLPSLPAGSNAIGTVTAVDATTSNFSLIAAASTNSTSIKASAGELLEVTVYNTSATIAWVKFYDSGSAPTCGSGTPAARYMIPGASSGGAGSNVVIPMGKNFASGIGMCITTGIADADTGAVAATSYVVNATYR